MLTLQPKAELIADVSEAHQILGAIMRNWPLHGIAPELEGRIRAFLENKRPAFTCPCCGDEARCSGCGYEDIEREAYERATATAKRTPA